MGSWSDIETDVDLQRFRDPISETRILKSGLEIGGLDARIPDNADKADNMNRTSDVDAADVDNNVGGNKSADAGREVDALYFGDRTSEIRFW